MNKIQKAKLVRIVKNDCLHASEYFSITGETCVIGAMALAVKFKRELLEKHNRQSIGPVFRDSNTPVLNRLVEILSEAFGLTDEQLGCIQELNDEGDTPGQRRRAILAYLKTI